MTNFYFPDYPPLKLEVIKINEIAESKGGRLSSIIYKHCEEKLEFENDKGERFFRSSNYVKDGK